MDKQGFGIGAAIVAAALTAEVLHSILTMGPFVSEHPRIFINSEEIEFRHDHLGEPFLTPQTATDGVLRVVMSSQPLLFTSR